MHGGGLHQWQNGDGAPALWLLAGTGEGPALAQALLERGWQLLVSVVTPEAARAYAAHPRLRLQVGPLADAAAEATLAALRPRWVVDATHPFAVQISGLLEHLCQQQHQPLLRLERRWVPAGAAVNLERLPALSALADLDLRDERLLLAIGSRHLPAALAASNAGAHFARVLERPASLQLALAAGLPDQHLACLRPDPRGVGALERALCRRWRITAVLCRQSGGGGEALWQQLCADLGLRLLLLERPPAAGTAQALPLEALLEKLGRP
jgi:precorrin-6A/cobalt-precorrin-6A reductase